MGSWRVVMAGTGNVSAVLGGLIRSRGHSIVSVAGRDIDKATLLAQAWGAEPTTSFDFTETKADLCILAVSDPALAGCAEWLHTGGMVTVHTAGSVPMGVLRPVAEHRGVLYPLQSLNANATMAPVIPFLVDGSTEEVAGFVADFARSLSQDVRRADDKERADTHLAAVLSSNFINHLMALTEDFCRMNDIPFIGLRPLLRETIERAFIVSPSDVQTGPAARNDIDTLKSHLVRLNETPELRDLYLVLSRSILERKGFDGGSL